MSIRVLDQHTAELIAAGEVVERPASVVKELVENAIDAGATNITVEIERGGIALIRIQDDGSGIEAEEIPLAFLRHATSKVRTQEDLDSISTLGFRGEALASIASVSQVELLSKTQQDEFASLYRIAGGQEQGIEAAARPIGTTISIRNLFYNTPARMKFLKKDTSEGMFVAETVTRLALSHPEIAFCFRRDGKQVFATPGDGNLQSSAYAVLGAEFARELLQVETHNKQYRVTGLLTPPRGVRASRSMQFFYINGRFVKNRTMMAALEQAYRGMMMQGKFPGCILFLQMPPELVDVNVHPAKTEVRFARESDVFEAVYTAVKSALMMSTTAHSQLDIGTKFATEPAVPATTKTKLPPVPDTTNFIASVNKMEKPHLLPDPARIRAYNSIVDTLASDAGAVPYETKSRAGSFDAKRIYAESALSIQNDEVERMPLHVSVVAPAEPPVQKPAEQTAFFGAVDAPLQEPIRFVGELFKTYIVAEVGQTLCLIDKHAAHERILYEQLTENRGTVGSQQLLSPVTVVLSAEEKSALLQNEEALQKAGIEVEDFGGNSVVVRGVPADIEPDSVSDLAVEIATKLSVNSKDNLTQKTDWVLHSVACRAAIKAGERTHQSQLLSLAKDILAGKVPPFCPHGRPVVLEITRKELEKQFGRLG